MNEKASMNPMELQEHFRKLRENQLNQWGVTGNVTLSKTIPEVAAELMYREFKLSLTDISDLPIVFVLGWKAVMEFVKSQNLPEFSVDVCGISVEYVTEYSETEKNSNIVPQLVHKRQCR